MKLRSARFVAGLEKYAFRFRNDTLLKIEAFPYAVSSWTNSGPLQIPTGHSSQHAVIQDLQICCVEIKILASVRASNCFRDGCRLDKVQDE